MASDVIAVLDELGLASAALCGFSLGANTALRVAACHPERVAAIAAIGSGPGQVGFSDLYPEEADDTRALRFEREGMAFLVSKLEGEGRPERARLVSQADPLAMAAWNRGWYLYEPIPERLIDLAMPGLFAWGELEIEGEVLPGPSAGRPSRRGARRRPCRRPAASGCDPPGTTHVVGSSGVSEPSARLTASRGDVWRLWLRRRGR